MDHRERVARAICSACEENPEHSGDARGNARRWQDYLPIADAAIAALAGDGVLVRLDRPEGYEDVHPQLVSEDAIGERWPSYETLITGKGEHPDQQGS